MGSGSVWKRPESAADRPHEPHLQSVPQNSMDEIRVSWSEHKGHRYLDIRVYTDIEGKADKVPTKKAKAASSCSCPRVTRVMSRRARSSPASRRNPTARVCSPSSARK